ncbi:metallophosphoesterase [Burkholderia gladioli]|uniref:metallophosphoesterase n=1 Tax=Burkholderia gladioli TaxID=28095 RepID=UPI00163F085B|nr:metallophosphoesterase [Burkholderia gladioli]
MRKFSWLQLSDLHIGQSHQWLWPNFKSVFHSDLRRLLQEVNPIDVVIFSGDLTHRGSKKEFDALNQELYEIWDIFKEMGCAPILFPVPGNHDLVRPPANDARVKLLKQWSTDSEVRKEFWTENDNQYIQLIRSAFENYEEWFNAIDVDRIPTATGKRGLIPGDISTSLSCGGISVGLIGLNTAFLQLTGDDFLGKLTIDPRQLNEVTGGSPPVWCEQHEINILVTHHPVSWLSPDAVSDFHAEIHPTGRFTFHLFGHMHDPDLIATAHGGDAGRRTFQSSSLFGMEYLGDGRTERVHGYSLGQITFGDVATSRLWPRKGILNRKSGDRRIVPDHENFTIVPGKEYLEEIFSLANVPSSLPKLSPRAETPDLASSVEGFSPEWGQAVEGTRYPLSEHEHHVPIRSLEQQALVEHIRQKKISWICADWGLGRDGFIWSVLKRMGKDAQNVYRIDLGNYERRETFLSDFSRHHGCAFPEYCTALASAGPAILLFDEAPVSNGQSAGPGLERDAGGLAEMVRDFCPDVLVLLLARRTPKDNRIGVVTLESLDEAETKTYLLSHPKADEESRRPRAVTEIFRRTDGLPGKIDRLLNTLRVISLSELGPPTGSELADHSIANELIPSSLGMAVNEILESFDPHLKRSALLLKVLSILPYGESLQRLRRIDNQQPIFPRHAEELLDRDLIQTRPSSALIISPDGNAERMKILFAPRQVRDYVLSKVQSREIEGLVRKGASLYFGEQWRFGSASLRKLDGPLISEDGGLLANPHSLVIWLLSSPATWQKNESATAVLGLCRLYCGALSAAKLYRHCTTVCRDVLNLVPEDEHLADRDTLEILLARSLRMSREYSEAVTLLERLLSFDRPKETKASLLLTLALSFQAMGDERAIDVAKDVIKLLPKSSSALQAQSIILEMSGHAGSSKELLKLENEARRRGFDTVANNIVLGRADEEDGDGSFTETLRHVYRTAVASDDHYNAARAVVKLCTGQLRKANDLSNGDLRLLIDAYQYFYGQRLSGLFSGAHKALWEFFEGKRDARNLLSLFRHSSFIWRLHENEKREQIYADRLIKNFRKILSTDILTADKNTAYFLLRAQKAKNNGQES